MTGDGVAHMLKVFTDGRWLGLAKLEHMRVFTSVYAEKQTQTHTWGLRIYYLLFVGL